jgi:hypothetical protein
MKKRTHIDMSIGDVIDRISILSRKIQFGEEGAYQEHTYLTQGIEKLNIKLTGALLACIIRLCYSNFEVWNRENAFRRGEEMTGEQVKQMMIEVREFNSKRIEQINELNRLTEMGFRTFKVQHRSR